MLGMFHLCSSRKKTFLKLKFVSTKMRKNHILSPEQSLTSRQVIGSWIATRNDHQSVIHRTCLCNLLQEDSVVGVPNWDSFAWPDLGFPGKSAQLCNSVHPAPSDPKIHCWNSTGMVKSEVGGSVWQSLGSPLKRWHLQLFYAFLSKKNKNKKIASLQSNRMHTYISEGV